MPEETLQPGISVVVCCHDSAAVIGPTLRALAGQRLPAGRGCEVILVDNACADDTSGLARAAWEDAKAGHPLRIVSEPMPGLIHARRRGVAAARFDLLLFVDDDNVVAEGALAVLASLYERHPQAAGIGGRVEPLFPGPPPAWFPLAAGSYACTPPGPEADHAGPRITMSGAGFSFRTRCLLAVFASSTPLFLVGRRGAALSRGEDGEICLRVGLRGGGLRYEPGFRVGHALRAERLNWPYVLEARRWYGRADVVLGMYKDVLAGQPPPAHAERLARVEEKLSRLQRRAAGPEPPARPGSRLALKLSLLAGMRQELMEIGPQRYEEIRAAIRALAAAGAGAA